MKPPAKHYIAEWERHPDLFVYPITALYDLEAARTVAIAAGLHFHFPIPRLEKNKRRLVSICYGFGLAGEPHPCRIVLGANFTAGVLLHELTHAWLFWSDGDHRHDGNFKASMNAMCDWFRLDETAQGCLFP
jgi:hypothetical protein